MSGTFNDSISRATVERKLKEADKELDDAVKAGAEAQSKYWLGRKRALQDLLEDGRQ